MQVRCQVCKLLNLLRKIRALGLNFTKIRFAALEKIGSQPVDPPLEKKIALEYRKNMADSLPAVYEDDKLPRNLPPLFDGDLTRPMRRWLRGITLYGTINGASRYSKLDSRWHYNWLKRYNDYSVAYEEAKRIFVSSQAEGAIVERGIAGYEKQLHYKGKLTGDKIIEYSDMLALAYLKAHDPRYRDGNQIAIGPAKISIEITQSSKTADDEIVIKSE
jgi:hypothetical protein